MNHFNVLEELVEFTDESNCSWIELNAKYRDAMTDNKVNVSVMVDADTNELIEAIAYITDAKVTYRWVNPDKRDLYLGAFSSRGIIQDWIIMWWSAGEIGSIYLDVETFDEFLSITKDMIEGKAPPTIRVKMTHDEFMRFYLPEGISNGCPV